MGIRRRSRQHVRGRVRFEIHRNCGGQNRTVFSGSLDGHLRAYSTAAGEVIWDMDTAKEYETVNGQKARGGSLDAAGAVITGGMLYVNSGYGQWGGMPGNVLLAFSVDGK